MEEGEKTQQGKQEASDHSKDQGDTELMSVHSDDPHIFDSGVSIKCYLIK